MLKNQDFSGLVLDIHGKDFAKGDITLDYPLLDKYKEFREYLGTAGGGLNRNKIIALINYLYSIKSPLVKIYRDDILIRKEEAAKLAGFSPDNKKQWIKLKEDFFNLGDPIISKMIVRFLIIQNSRLWAMIIAAEQNFYSIQYYVMNQF